MRSLRADDGETIRVAVAGEGPALVLLHGWTVSHAEWSPLMNELSPGFTTYRWDARAHGGHAPGTATAPTVQRMARDLRNLLEDFGLEGATVVGHSMGVLTIWEYVRQFGTRGLGRLVLVDQSPKLVTDATWRHGIYGDFDAARSAAFLADLEADFAEAVLRLAALGLNERARRKYAEDSRGWQIARSALRKQAPAPLVATWRSLVEADWRDVLPAIDVPTLLVYGAESNFYDAPTRDWVHANIPGSRLRVYENADHSPHQAAPQRFVRDLREFLA